MRRWNIMNSMAGKTIVVLLVVILIPTICISVNFYISASSVVKQNVRQTSLQIVDQAAISLSHILNVGSDTSDLIYSDVTIQKVVIKESSSPDAHEFDGVDSSYINHKLNDITYSSSFVKMIYVLREQGTSWGSGIFYQPKVSRYEFSKFPWVEPAKALDGRLFWSELQYDQFSGVGNSPDLVVPSVRVLKDFRDLSNIGYIMVNVDGRTVLNKISQLSLGKTGHFYVVNQEGVMMINKDLGLIGQPLSNSNLKEHVLNEKIREFEYTDNHVEFYGLKQSLSNGWILVGIVPIQELTGPLDRLRTSIFQWSIGLFLFAIAIGLWSARKITRPVGQLIKQMKLVAEGNLKARTTIESTDEIGQLSSQFNKMIYKVDQLMEQVQEEQSNKRKAELQAVTHQINPHFMFNTLNTIRWLVKFGDKNKAYEGITNFNRLMEAYMGKTGMMVPIREELEIIAKYTDILQLRYDLIFTLHTKVDPGALECMIPRMFFQPIVENAIFHGIVPSGQNGEINITITDFPDHIVVQISNNGMGMSNEQLNRLSRLQHKRDFSEVGIGLKHVVECIHLYFPPGSELEVFRNAGQGTVVQLKLIKNGHD